MTLQTLIPEESTGLTAVERLLNQEEQEAALKAQKRQAKKARHKATKQQSIFAEPIASSSQQSNHSPTAAVNTSCMAASSSHTSDLDRVTLSVSSVQLEPLTEATLEKRADMPAVDEHQKAGAWPVQKLFSCPITKVMQLHENMDFDEAMNVYM